MTDFAPPLDSRASANGHKPNRWAEIGTLGLEATGGFVQAAYHAELQWPGCYPLYNRLRRADPEVAIVRQIFSAVAARVRLEFRRPQTDIPENDDDKRALEFAQSSLLDLQGGPQKFLDKMVSEVPFMGWGYWEAVPGLRRKDWRPPQGDDWRSEYDDGLVGFRRLAWRDHSSFHQWDLEDSTGRLRGMVQQTPNNEQVTIPIGRAIHVTFGDADNPEGLTPLEAMWRLERIKFGLEVIQGIGYEHAAGYLDVKKTKPGDMTATDLANIKRAARAVLSAQEGNYAAWPEGFEGEVKDVSFAASAALLEAIRYYGLLKLTLYNMQWVGMSVISGSGSFAALKDSSAMWLVAFNAMMGGFARQLDQQYGKRLFAMNPDAFPAMTKRPELVVTDVEKSIDLTELGQLLTALAGTMPLGDDDWLAVRRQTHFLPEALPEVEEQPEAEGETPPDDSDDLGEAEDDAGDDMDEVPEDTELSLDWRARMFDRAMKRFNRALGKGGE